MILRYGSGICLLLLLAGCQAPEVSAHIESVNAEYRQLEDYVYCLEEENARLCRELELQRQRGTTTKSSEGRGGLFKRRPSGTRDPVDPATPSDPPVIELPGTSSSPAPSAPAGRGRSGPTDSAPGSQGPVIELPAPSAARPAAPGPVKQTAAEAPIARPLPPKKPADSKITHLFLEPELTGGADFDGQPGSDGLIVVLEPRNSAEQYVPQAGAVSIVVLDPSREGDVARIARWDFDRKAVEQLVQSSADTNGIKIELPWPAAPPTSTKLQLFVRYETADGRRLQSDREIAVAPRSQIVSRWTPRPADRHRPAELGDSSSTVQITPPTGADGSALPPGVTPNGAATKASERTEITTAPAALSDDVPASRSSRTGWSPFR